MSPRRVLRGCRNYNHPNLLVRHKSYRCRWEYSHKHHRVALVETAHAKLLINVPRGSKRSERLRTVMYIVLIVRLEQNLDAVQRRRQSLCHGACNTARNQALIKIFPITVAFRHHFWTARMYEITNCSRSKCHPRLTRHDTASSTCYHHQVAPSQS